MSVIGGMNKRGTPALPARLAGFTPRELNQRLPLAEAAAINEFKDPESFQRNYPHLVRQTGKRKRTVTLYDALMLPPPGKSGGA